MSASSAEIVRKIAVDPSSPVPKHVQIRDALAEMIDGGVLPPGAKLPAVRALAGACGVALRTAGLAVELLQREGRAVSHVGRGVFVREVEKPKTRRVVYVCLKADILNQHAGARFRTLQGIIRKAAEFEVELRPVTQTRDIERYLPLDDNAGVLFMDAEYEKAGFGEISAYVQGRNVPCCTANNRRPPPPGVDAQHGHAALIATEHLLLLGHRRIALLSKPPQINSQRHDLLLSGYVKALRRYGVYPDPALVMELPEGVDEAAAALPEALGRILALAPPPTAFLSDSDENALHLLGLLPERGIKVPEDVSVVGHENMPACESSNPPLTTVDAKCPERGEKALEYVLAKMDGHEMAEPLVYPELVARGSTAPCREAGVLNAAAGSP